MKRSKIVGVIFFGLLFQLTLQTPAQPPEKLELRTYPLASVYTTNSQKGVKRIPRSDAFDRITQKTAGLGASTVFLVRAKDISEALFGTDSVLIGYSPADEPPDTSEAKDIWLVAYFGVSAPGNAWVVNSVEKKGKKAIRVTYEPGTLGEETVTVQYFAWVPLGKLDAGSYAVELFNAKEKEVILMRRVTIGK